MSWSSNYLIGCAQSALLSAALWVLLQTSQRPTCVKQPFDRLLQCKMLVCLTLIATHAASLVLQVDTTTSGARRLAFLESVLLLSITYQKHKRDISSSTFVSFYLPISASLELPLARSIPSLSYYHIPILEAISVALKLSTLLLHETSKWTYLTDDDAAEIVRESASGFWSKCLALHLTPVLRTGSKREMSHDDLSSVPPELLSSTSMKRFQAIWEDYKLLANGLIKACLRMERPRFIAAVLSGMLAVTLHTCIPLLIGSVVELVEDRAYATHGQDTPTQGQLLIIATAIFTGEAILQGYALRCLTRTNTSIRGVLLGSIFNSVTYLSDSKLATTAKSSILANEISSLGKIDSLYYVVVRVFHVALCAWLLWYTLSTRTLWLLCFSFGMTFSTLYVGKSMSKRLTAQHEATTVRSTTSANLLRNIQSIRLLGLEEQLRRTVISLQSDELQAISKSLGEQRKQQIIIASYMPLGGFFAFSNAIFPSSPNDTEMHLAKFFTALALAYEFCFAITTFIHNAARLKSVLTSFSKIQEQLLAWKEDSPDEPVNPLLDPDMNGDSNSPGTIELDDVAVAIAVDEDPVVTDITMYIPGGSTTVVAGPVGCGKSTLLSAIAGRAAILEGRMEVSQTRIAYSHQIPWLQDRTIRDNIVGPNKFDLEWYNAAKTACCLNRDLAMLPLADEYMVGAKGGNLSRAVQQRICLARVVYSKAPIVLLDDPLSSQEKPVADQLIEQVFGHYGILRPTTVVLTSSKPLPYSLVATHALCIDATGAAREISTRRLLEIGVVVSQPVTHDPENIPQERAAESHSAWDLLAKPINPNVNKSRFQSTRRGQSSWKFCYTGVDRGLFIVAFGINFVMTFTESFPYILLQRWFESTSTTPFPILYCAIITSLNGVADVIFAILWHNRICRQFAQYSLDYLLDRIMKITIASWDPVKSEAMIGLFNEAMQLVTFDLGYELKYVIALINTVLVCWGVVISCSPILVFAFVLFTVCFVGMKSIQHRASCQLLQMNLAAEDRLRTHFDETLAGAAQVTLLGWNKRYNEWSRAHIDHSLATLYNSATSKAWLINMTNLSTIPLGLAFVAASLYVDIAPHLVGLSLVVMLEICKISLVYIPFWGACETSWASMNRIHGLIMKAPVEVDRKDSDLPAQWPAKGVIQVHGASIWQDAHVSRGERPQLENVTFDTSRHRRIGIHGDCEKYTSNTTCWLRI
ncbi:hypothetical protein VHEMI01554 [[Torrubiella] hemipterigena]|uniref:ABC transporter n=1 Tax=[Torrubiella] hemipterigena TaxID=1531966 RepID=A0A0A1T537_9HYPO|nr:hypothetical protein VHEMI01554 [[Torrubiella] hemipterigena]